MPYFLYRVRDGAGASGPMSDLLIPTVDMDTNKIVNWETLHNSKPRIGGLIKVGSPYARTYSVQDWWRTSIITEIIEDTENYVRFRTGNSEYEWRKF